MARDQAADVGQHARAAGGQVTQTAADQAKQVAAETGRQARDLLGEAQGHATSQASAQQQRAAQQLHSVADELGQMASNSEQSGVATEFAHQAANRVHGAASWLEQREPADLLDEVRNFARRRPGAFLIGAAVAGLVAGRLTRGLKDRGNGSNNQPSSGPGYGRTVPGVPAASSVDPAYATETYPAAPGYATGTEPVDPAYPAEPGYGVGTAGYPADPALPADPVISREPRTTPGYEGPR